MRKVNRPTRATPAITEVRRQQRTFERQFTPRPATWEGLLRDTKLAITGTKDPEALDWALGAALLGLPAGRLARPLARLGRAAKAGEKAAGASKASTAGERVAAGSRSARRGSAASAARSASRASKATTPAARVKAAGRAAAARAPRTAKAAKVAGRTAKGTAKVTGKAASYPIRHPLKTTKYSVAAQVPAAVATGDPKQLAAPFRGEGVVSDVLGSVGRTVSEIAPGEAAQNLVRDVFDLPANTPPALYMPIAGVVEAAQGDASRLSALWEDYKRQGLIPAVLSGDKDRIIDTITKHPLYAGLEASGARAVVGRGLGAAARRAPSRRARQAGSVKRKPLRVRGTKIAEDRTYSPDLIEKAIQVAGDVRRARRTGGQYASPRQRTRLTSERVDRLVAQTEGVRRGNRQEQIAGTRATRPGRLDREGVSLAVQGIIRSPRTFGEDLASYGARLDRQASRMRKQIRGAPDRKTKGVTRARLKANRNLRGTVEALRERGNPEAIFAAARENAQALRSQTTQLEELGLLGEGQGARAAAIPFAVQHMGARRQGGVLTDREGKPLPTEAIEAEMRRQGVSPEEVGFVTQQPVARGPGSFYRAAFPDRQTLPKQARTGRATRQGTFDASFDAVLEQRVRNQGIIDATKGFDRIVGELAVGRRRFGNWREAAEAILHPKAHGLPEGVQLVRVRLAPFSARSKEVRTAEQRFDALDPSDQLGRQRVAEGLADAALQEGPGPVVLLPKQAAQRLKEHFTAATTFRRAAQLVSSTFKGTVLPVSPNWLLGNVVDVSMRSMLSGTIPWGRDAHLGRAMMREVRKQDPEAAARLESIATPGSLIGSASRSRVHRDARQFAETRLGPLAAAMGALRRMPGLRHLTDAYRKYRDSVFAFNDRFIERQAQYAQLGKAGRREVREVTGKWHKALVLGDDAIRDLGKGLLKTDKQIRYAKQIEQTLGQWTSYGPEMRAFLLDYAPFGNWARAASRFVFLTMPARHPIKTGLIAAAAEMTEEERLRLGLSLFAKEGKRLPPELQGSIPLADGALLAPQSITSFGYVADWPRSLASTILPQVPLSELAGLDWTGSRLTHEDGTPLAVDERMKAVLLATGESYLPFVAMGRRLGEQGAYEGALPRSVRPYDPELVKWLQGLSASQEIQVPASPSEESDSSANPWLEDSESSASNPWLDSEDSGSSSNPWLDEGSSTSNPWLK